MPAPTALLRAPEQLAAEQTPLLDQSEVVLDTLMTTVDISAPPTTSDETQEDTDMQIDSEGRPVFAPEKTLAQVHRAETRKVPVPPHRFTPLKNAWPQIYPPLVEHLKLQVCFGKDGVVAEHES